jgi:arylsulfatase
MKKKIKSFINKIKNFVLDNKIFFLFVIVNVINDMVLRGITFGKLDNLFSIVPILSSVALVTLILSFVYLFKKEFSKKLYLISITVFLTLLCIINSSYYNYFSSYTSISQLVTTKYLGEVKDSLITVVKLRDFIYLVLPTILIAYILKTKYRFSNTKNFKSFLKVNNLTVICTVLFALNLKPVDYSRLVKQWNRIYLVEKFGLYVYHVNDVFQSVEPKLIAIFGYDKAKRNFNDYYAKRTDVQSYTNEYTNIFKGKNLISIHGESIQKFVINLKINGKEVTPNLNRLVKEGMYFSNYYSQVSVGTSSDSEFTINTSLMPAKVGVAFVSYFDREYVTIPKLFKSLGYYNMSFHANKGDFWNRNSMYKSLGYDKFYDQKAFNIDETIGLGLSDKSFFRQLTPILKKENDNHQNFYATLIMLTNHTPFPDISSYSKDPLDLKMYVTENGETKAYPYLEGTVLGRYLQSVHYADEALGELMEHLETNGLLENTVLMFYGDHDARLSSSEYKRFYNYDYKNDKTLDESDPNYKKYGYYEHELNRSVPFFFWSKNDNKKINKTITNVMGAYDILPTLGNMFGFYNKYALGSDIFNTNNDNTVIFPNGNYVTNKIYYNSQADEAYDIEKKEVIQKELEPREYINKRTKETEEKLNISNDILVYNLLKKVGLKTNDELKVGK